MKKVIEWRLHRKSTNVITIFKYGNIKTDIAFYKDAIIVRNNESFALNANEVIFQIQFRNPVNVPPFSS